MSLLGETRRHARLCAFATAAALTAGASLAGAYAAGAKTADAVREDQAGKLIALPRIGMQVAEFQHEASVRAGAVSPLERLLQADDPLAVASDVDCLTAAVYYEARGETREGQAAVAQVVLNRVRDAHFPKTVCAVVYQGAASHACQFSFACDAAADQRRDPGAWAQARSVADRALGGYVMAAVGRATHYHVADLGQIWGGELIRVAQIGQHVFYRRGHSFAASPGQAVAARAAATSAPPPDQRAAAPIQLGGALKPAPDPVDAALASADPP